MSTATAIKSAGKSTAQVLEENRTRHQALSDRRQRVEVELESAARQLSEAQDEAERDFGTRDLGELRRMYTQREQENENKVTKFVQGLDSLEKALADVERQLAA